MRTAPPNLPFAISAGLLATLLGAAAFWGADKKSLGLFHDDGVYAVVAKAIFEGDGYRIISLPGEPAQTKYPFLYSYLLSWLWFLYPNFPDNILVLKSLNVVVFIVIFFAALALYRHVFLTAGVGALAFGVLVCINPLVFTFTDFVTSDLLFVLFGLVALVVSRQRPARALRFGLLAGLACLTRLAAVPLVLAGFLESFRCQRLKGGFHFAVAVSFCVGPWLYWTLGHFIPSSSLLSYYTAYDLASSAPLEIGDRLARHAEIISGNAIYLLETFSMLYLLPLFPTLTPVAAGFTLLGMAVSRRRNDFFNWMFLLFSIAVLLIWPFHPARYAASLAPMLLLFLFRGIATAEFWLNARGAEHPFMPLLAKLPWLTLVALLLLQGVWISSYLFIRDPYTTRGGFGARMQYGWSGFEESFAWIRQHTSGQARLATAYDPMYFLYTGRQAIRPALHRSATYFYPYGAANPDVGSAAEIKLELDAMSIDYLIIDPLDGYAEGTATIRLMEELVATYGVEAKPVFTSTDGKHRIYALR